MQRKTKLQPSSTPLEEQQTNLWQDHPFSRSIVRANAEERAKLGFAQFGLPKISMGYQLAFHSPHKAGSVTTQCWN
jgi:hypothetical protein